MSTSFEFTISEASRTLINLFEFFRINNLTNVRQRISKFHAQEHASIKKFVCCFCDIFVNSNELIFLHKDDAMLSFLNDRMNICAFRKK
jgi:hypothetical protein